MGLWGAVTVATSGAVTLRSPMVSTNFVDDTLANADLKVGATVANTSGAPVRGTLRGSIAGLAQPISFELPLTLAGHETRESEGCRGFEGRSSRRMVALWLGRSAP